MKAITITQAILNNNPTLTLTVDDIYSVNNLPKQWNGFHNYNSVNNEDMQIADGWKDVITPSYNTATQKLGDLYFDEPNDYFTYTVVDKTNEEIQIELQTNSEANKQTLIQQQLEAQVVADAQASDDTNSLDNQDLFPFWEIGFYYTIDYKCQHFNATNELKLYKCVQAHTSQSDWQPKDVPALFTVVAYPNEIPVFVQPTGAQDAYQTGDQVYYPDENGSVYESLIDANVWSPDAYPQGWQLIS